MAAALAITQRNQRHMDATAAERGAQFGVAVLDQFDREARPQRRSNRLQQFCGRRADDAKFQFGRLKSEEHTSELQSLMRISYAVFCLKKKKILSSKQTTNINTSHTNHH